MKFLGYEMVDYINKNEKRIEGARVHCSFKNSNTHGEATKTIFLGKSKIERNGIDLDSMIGKEIQCIMNAYNSIEKIEVISND